MIRPAHDNAVLGNVRVLEMSDVLGQYCGKLLADMGADVIKIEPVEGSPVRRVGPFAGDEPGLERSLTFWHYNTSKRGVTLNLGTPEGREVFLKLVVDADILIESFEPGYLADLGLDHSALHALNPRLVQCAVTPFGQEGPWRDLLTSDLIHMALGGTMASSGYDDVEGAPPIAPTGGNAYHTASHIAASAIMIALLSARRDGLGQYIDMAVHDAAAVTTEGAFGTYEYGGQVVRRQTGRHAGAAISPKWNFRTRDDKLLSALLLGLSPKRWLQLAAWMNETGDAEDLTGPRYADSTQFQPDIAHVTDVVGRFIAKHDLDYLYHNAQKLRLAWSPIRPVEDLFDDPHLAEREFFTEVEHPQIGRAVTYVGAPYKFSRSHWDLRGRAPLLGEHNREIYVSELGLPPAILPALRESSII